MPMSYEYELSSATSSLLGEIVNGWNARTAKAVEKKKPFSAITEQCEQFFSGAADFMWSADYQDKYIAMRQPHKLNPRFKVTLQKAFELVATFGPSLYWNWPARIVSPKQQPPLPDLIAQQAAQDPQWGQVYQAYQSESLGINVQKTMTAFLLQQWLNYTPDEQPGGGLSTQSMLAITDALVKGRGILVQEPYIYPGGARTITGSFFKSVDQQFIDPDALSLLDAKYIIMTDVCQKWELERRYNLPPGTIRGGFMSQNQSASSTLDPLAKLHWASGNSQDVVRYYKVWSKCGIGARFHQGASEAYKLLDEQVGDYAYMVLVPGYPCPLNCPHDLLNTAAITGNDAMLAECFRWPIESWRDNRWPMSMLDFYPVPNSPWPIPPLSPGVGPLTIINMLLSRFMSRTWNSSRDIYLIAQEAYAACANLKETLEGTDDVAVCTVTASLQKSMQEYVTLLQQPEIKSGDWAILDRMTDIFERATGLSELLAGFSSGPQSRSAADAQSKRDFATARPQYMAGQVEKFMIEVARNEASVSRIFIRGQDTITLLGHVGGSLWDTHVASGDSDQVYAELDIDVEAGGTQKPQRAKEQEAIKDAMQFLLPTLTQHYTQTGDAAPINAFIDRWGKSVEIDASSMHLPDAPPPQAPPPASAVPPPPVDLNQSA